jgi:hypothetical protein
MMKVETREFRDEEALKARLLQLSRTDRRAYVALVQPFTHTTTIIAFANPSRVPDRLIELVAPLHRVAGAVARFHPGRNQP